MMPWVACCRRIVVALCLAAGASVQAQPVHQKDADFGLPQVPTTSAPPVFRPVERTAVPDSVKASATDSVKSSSVPALVAGSAPHRDSGECRIAKPQPDRRLDPVREPDRSKTSPGMARIGKATATLLTGVASTTFGLCYWHYHTRINRQLEGMPVNGLGLMITATLAIPIGVVLTWNGVTQLF